MILYFSSSNGFLSQTHHFGESIPLSLRQNFNNYSFLENMTKLGAMFA
ncbi:hypothetical protein HMPREF9176_0427 [Streptococcus downei F0415]|nr:hypothetical protein HMPREF9176_0427 [Streptococcus downei F0415]